ncbi:hypothetical protein PHMEG_00016213 [Phytophthora megakarya]|uniref:BZIP domain-containing protein n=1 Tax=Phytophthora megakarya TaxID=4795 RepID=A0A225W0F3_9STRA|nr:hypothetical protein PHMEG_00016213 [Phytophthora megakarya]
MLMEHQGRSTWTPSYSSSMSVSTTTSLDYDALRPAAYSTEHSLYQPQDSDNHYRYPFSEASRPTFAPLPPPPRDDPLAPSRLRYLPPSLPRPMIGGSLSPHVRMDKLSPMSAPVFTIKTGGPATPKRATDEERRAKHREAQRRFVKRKKIEMMQLKQLAVELEKRHDLLQAVSERETLVRENQALMQQLESQNEEDRESPSQSVQDEQVKQEMKEERPRSEIQWETRTFEW